VSRIRVRKNQVRINVGGTTANVTSASLQSIQSRITAMAKSLRRSARIMTTPEVKSS